MELCFSKLREICEIIRSSYFLENLVKAASTPFAEIPNIQDGAFRENR